MLAGVNDIIEIVANRSILEFLICYAAVKVGDSFLGGLGEGLSKFITSTIGDKLRKNENVLANSDQFKSYLLRVQDLNGIVTVGPNLPAPQNRYGGAEIPCCDEQLTEFAARCSFLLRLDLELPEVYRRVAELTGGEAGNINLTIDIGKGLNLDIFWCQDPDTFESRRNTTIVYDSNTNSFQYENK